MREPKNKERTTLTLIREDVVMILELQQKLEAKYKIPFKLIDVVRHTMRQQLENI